MFRVALHRRGGHGSEALDASGTFLGVCGGKVGNEMETFIVAGGGWPYWDTWWVGKDDVF